MAAGTNSFWTSLVDLVSGALARASDVNSRMDGIAEGFDAVETELDKCIQITTPGGMTVDIAENAAARAGMILGFDASGNVEARTQSTDYFANVTGAVTATHTELNALDGVTATGTSLIQAASAAAARTAIGAGTMATQAASAVAITGGAIAGITDLAVADGGTGASSAAGARTALDVMQDVFTTRGDLVRAGASGVAERVALEAAGYILRSDGTDAVWYRPVYGALSYPSADVGKASGVLVQANFNTEVYDYAACLSNGGSPTHSIITVPAGVTMMRVNVQASFAANATGSRGVALLTDAGADLAPPVNVYHAASTTGVETHLHLDSGWRVVTPAATYRIDTYQNSGGALNLLSTSWLAVEFK